MRDLIYDYNQHHKLETSKTKSEIAKDIQSLYEKTFLRFLNGMGIEVEGENKYWWKFSEKMPEIFVRNIYFQMFENLTDCGRVERSHNFLQLFPDLALYSDPRSTAALPKISMNVQERLQVKGKIHPEEEPLLRFLDQLLVEEETIKSSLKIFEQSNGISSNKNSFSLLNFEKERQTKRLAEIHQSISQIKDELHKLTGNIDKIKPKVVIGTIIEKLSELQTNSNEEDEVNMDSKKEEGEYQENNEQ